MKNKKYLIFIIVFIILLLAIVSTIFFVTKNNNNSNTMTPEQSGYTHLDNKQFLTTIGSWEQEGAPGIIMVFNEDGTGKNTTNMGTEWFNMKWILESNLLIATTEWITQDLENDWIVNFDKENVVLELTDVDSQKTIKYVKKGSQKIDLDESKKDKVLIGEWISQDVYPRALSLQSNTEILSGVGMFDTENNIAYIETEFLKWSADGTTLKLLQSNGKINEYTYKLDENHIILYKGEELINVYKKATNAKVEKLN